jgi:L-alanine-DL-glutamate epimerase-like enolase superfamily enzyme
MKLSIEPLTLHLVQPFAIAHGTSLTRDNVLVRIEGGLGEAAAVPYLGETRDGITRYLQALDLSAASDPFDLEGVLGSLPPGSAAARAAVDIGLHDAFAQRLGQPLYRLLGLNPARCPETSFTLPIAAPEAMAAQARASAFSVLKLKLGGSDAALDAARVEAVRGATRARLRADANAGWTLAQALRMLPLLAEHGVELIEQPLPAGDLDGYRTLSKLTQRPPIFADESIRSSADIALHAGLVEGVVLKLQKCGGIRPALRDIAVARALGLEVMLSCMIESSVAVTAAAHLAPLCQHVDLDGPLLIQNDPFEGIRYAAGRILLPERPGLGLIERRA